MAEHQIVSLHAGYKRSDGSFIDAFLSRPSTPGPWPGVVLLSGMHGVNWFQRQVTREFARAGFVALSPDLIDGAHPKDQAEALLGKNSVNLETAVDIAVHGARFLRELPWVDQQSQIGIVGFCLGGGLALVTLARSDAFGAGIIYYHSLFPDPEEIRRINKPLLCQYGTADKTTPMEEVEAFRETLERYEKDFEIVLYDDMPHSFINTTSGATTKRKKAVEDSLARSYAFLHQKLAPSKTAPEPEPVTAQTADQ